MEHDAGNLPPVGAFSIGIKHPHVGDSVLFVIRREGPLGRSNVGNVGVERWRFCMVLLRGQAQIIHELCVTLGQGHLAIERPTDTIFLNSLRAAGLSSWTQPPLVGSARADNTRPGLAFA